MTIALAIFAVIIVVASVVTVIFPSEIVAYATEFLADPWGIWWAAAIRLVLAVLLWFSAPRSHTPVTFRILAVVTLLAAVAIPIMGTESLLLLLEWLAAQPLLAVRVPSALGVAFGGFILWSLYRKRAEG